MLLLSQYTLLEKISDRLYTQIYRGYRNSDNLPVICKFLSNPHPSPKEIVQFQREYYLTQRLSGQGFVQAIDLQAYKNSWFMILEDIKGKPLSSLLDIYLNDIESSLKLAIRLTEIIGNLHQQQIIHKDINPSNVIINLETQQVQLIDFEIATELSRETQEICSPDTLEGNLSYISPEQTGRMNRSIDYRTDLYSLGVTLYELFTGELPFQAQDAMEWVHCHLAKSPVPPIELNSNLPYTLSAIILRLLEKTAEKRYQGTFGLQADLQTCLTQWQSNKQIENFTLATKDASSYFQIPEKLYGRTVEVKQLLVGFERISQGGTELLLIAGYSGVGKSALVHEVHKFFVKQKGYFIRGKFDQFKRNIPYDSLFQAFRELIRQLLTENDARRSLWRKRLLDALGPNGQVLIDVVPDIELLIGAQPPVPELSPSAARNRFNLVLLNFIGTFAEAGCALIIFLDDLQWADAATLQLLELLMDEDKTRQLLLLGAYRDNEVDDVHPLQLSIKRIREHGAFVNILNLKPLQLEDVTQLIAESLKAPFSEVKEIARICFDKTLGNPFFLTQLLHTFHHQGAIHFDKQRGLWMWDVKQMQSAAISDNVVDLMVKKICLLSLECQNTLKLAACIGNQFDLKILSVVSQKSLVFTANALWQALREELVLPLDNTYKFAEHTTNLSEAKQSALIPVYRFIHDRVQQAAYSLIEASEKAKTHFKVGKLLLENSSKAELEERLFEIVNHLNLAIELIHEPNERKYLAQLNLTAGKTAKSSAAYQPALSYLGQGLALLASDCWNADYELSLELYIEATEAAFLNGDYAQMEKWATLVLKQSRDILDRVRIYEIQIQAFMAQNYPLKAIALALDVLRFLGVHFPRKPSLFHILRDSMRARVMLWGYKIENLRQLPVTTRPHDLAVMRIMNRIYSAAYIADTKQMVLTSIKLMGFSVKHGNSPISAFAYASYGLISCGVTGEISVGHRFGKLALQVLEDFNANELKCRTYFMVYNFVWHWEAPLVETLAPLLEAYHVGVDTGELEFAGYSVFMYCNYSFFAGKPLEILAQETAKYVVAIDQIQQQTPLYYNQIVLQTILNLRADNLSTPWLLVGTAYNEHEMLPVHTKANDITALAFLYVHKMLLAYWFEAYDLVVEYAQKVDAMGVASMFHSTVFHFYAALGYLALMKAEGHNRNKRYLHGYQNSLKKMKVWAKHAPENNAHRVAVLNAEYCVLIGKREQAINLFKHSLELARKNHYIQEEGLICELYAKFWQKQGDITISSSYIKEAHYLYQLWGATAKLELLKKNYPDMSLSVIARSSTPSRLNTVSLETQITQTGSLFSNLDLITIIKASRGLSEEVQLDSLLKKLISIVMENAGAQHGMLLLEKNQQWFVEAHSHTQNFSIFASHWVSFNPEADEIPIVPLGVLQHVIRKKQAIILENAQNESLYNGDTYIYTQGVKSLLCSPVLKQGKLIAIIYLENNLNTGVFTEERLELVNLIASQLAISLENARLYANLEEKVIQRTEKLAQANQEIQALNQRLAVENEKLAETQKVALAATESKSAFLANMSHEIRTPMNAIIGMVDILEGTNLDGEQREYLKTVRNSGTTLLTLINDILDFSKIEAKKLVLEQREFELRECVENALSQICGRAFEKNLNVIYWLEENVPLNVVGDSIRVQQILVNLLSNAVKFTEKGEIQINMSVQESGAHYCVLHTRVIDSGIGIPADKIEHLFQSFTQVDASTTRKYGGTGLGLTISQQLCELMEGKMWVESQENKGSTFHFTLKLTLNDVKTQARLLQINPRLQKKKVLLLNLLGSNHFLLENLIRRWGMERVNTLEDQPDIIVIELNNAYDIPILPEKDCPVIALTSFCQKHHRPPLFNACLTKPIRPQVFAEHFMRLLNNTAEKVAIVKEASPIRKFEEIKESALNILLVDDNDVNRKVALLQLRKLGYQADTANDGVEAVAALQNKRYDIIFMDMQMPRMDGIEATRIILNTAPAKNHPWIIAMTANAMKEDRDKCFAAGMNDYITKPVTLQDLKTALNNAEQAINIHTTD